MTHPLDSKVEEYLLMVKEQKRLAPKTIELYKMELRELVRILKDPLQVHGIASYLGMKAPDTHVRKLIMFKSFLSTCDEPWKGCLNKLSKPKLRQKEPHFFSDEEKQAIYLACLNKRDSLLCTFGMQLGLRLSEITGLKFHDIQNDFIKIKRKGSKEQRLPLSLNVRDQIEAYREERKVLPSSHQAIFKPESHNDRFSSNGIANIFRAILKRAGVKGSLHSMRHTFATNLVQRGAGINVVQELLGHAAVTTTMRYLHTTPNHLRSTINLLS